IRVERDQSIANWDRFPAPCVKKSLGTYRLIAAEQRVGEDLIICFLALMARGDGRYYQFQENPLAFVSAMLPSDTMLTGWLAERTETPVPVLPEPTPAEYSYLYDFLEASEDRVIYETHEWIRRVGAMN